MQLKKWHWAVIIAVIAVLLVVVFGKTLGLGFGLL